MGGFQTDENGPDDLRGTLAGGFEPEDDAVDPAAYPSDMDPRVGNVDPDEPVEE